MKSSPEPLRFERIVRDVRLRAHGDASAAVRRDHEAELAAAYQRGHQEGQRQLGDQLMQQRNEVRHLVDGVLTSLRQSVANVARDTEQHLVTLALEVARKVVADLPISPEMVEAAVRDAISRVEGSTEYHVRLNPADLELLRQVNSALLDPARNDAAITLHPATDITRGGCVVQTRFGVVDARRETKMELLERSILG